MLLIGWHKLISDWLLVFLGSFLQSNVYILLRMLREVHWSVTLLVFGVVGAVESSVFMITLGSPCIPQCGYERAMMIAIGALSFIGINTTEDI